MRGPWVHTIDGDTTPGRELPPGSSVFHPGKQMHDDLCQAGKTECIVFIHQHAKRDFIPKKTDAKAAQKPAEKQ